MATGGRRPRRLPTSPVAGLTTLVATFGRCQRTHNPDRSRAELEADGPPPPDRLQNPPLRVGRSEPAHDVAPFRDCGGVSRPAATTSRTRRTTCRAVSLGADFVVDKERCRFEKVCGSLNWNSGLRFPLTEPGVDIEAGDTCWRSRGRALGTGGSLEPVQEHSWPDRLDWVTPGAGSTERARDGKEERLERATARQRPCGTDPESILPAADTGFAANTGFDVTGHTIRTYNQTAFMA